MKLDVLMIFDVVITVLGIYMFTAALNMKKTNQTGTVILTEEEAVTCRDKAGFVSYIYPKEAIMGIVFVICGVIRFLNKMLWKISSAVDIISGILILLVFGWFYYGLQTAKKRYL